MKVLAWKAFINATEEIDFHTTTTGRKMVDAGNPFFRGEETLEKEFGANR
jgi:hypothetical protein